MTAAFDVDRARNAFPALKANHQVYFDNAGGSQVLGTVSSRIRDYLEETNVQLGASYDVAKQSTSTFEAGNAAAAAFINANPEEIVIGPSTTQLFSNLSQVLDIPPQSEFILSAVDHEANTSPWVRLAKLQGHQIKWWKPESTDGDLLLTPANLKPLLSSKTKFVSCTHASNVLGGIHDIKGIAETVHSVPGAMLCVDGVALAPHREIDVKEMDADFYSFSWYKVYGPHIAILYASPPVLKTLGSLGHYFHAGDSLSTKLGLAGGSYELIASIPDVVRYFGQDKAATWHSIANHEEKLQNILLTFLKQRADVTIYGDESIEGSQRRRVPVVSFVIDGRSSKAVVEAIEARSNFGCRWGHFYSKRLVDDFLGLANKDGVIRVSMVHYNTGEEVRRFVAVLEEVLDER